MCLSVAGLPNLASCDLGFRISTEPIVKNMTSITIPNTVWAID